MSLSRMYALLLALAIMPSAAMAQEGEHDAGAAPRGEEPEHHGMRGTHRVTLGLGHEHILNSVVGEDGELKNQTLPSWVLNYDYWLSDRWAVGVQTDVIIESFVIEYGDAELLEREYPVIVVATGIFRPFKHFAFLGGLGFEYAGGETLTATRLGVDYGKHLARDWEVGVSATWDLKWDYYDAWGLSLTVSRLFGGRH